MMVQRQQQQQHLQLILFDPSSVSFMRRQQQDEKEQRRHFFQDVDDDHFNNNNKVDDATIYTTAATTTASTKTTSTTTTTTTTTTSWPKNTTNTTKTPQPKQQQPHTQKLFNVVLLYGDDWRYDTLGKVLKKDTSSYAGGGDDVNVSVTPFLDWFRRTYAMSFVENYVTTSICWISRATLHTGLYYSNSRHLATLPSSISWYDNFGNGTYPGILKSFYNYTVGHVGKWQFQNFTEKLQSVGYYDYSRIYSGQHWYTITDNTTNVTRRIHAIDRATQDAIEFLQLYGSGGGGNGSGGNGGDYSPSSSTLTSENDDYDDAAATTTNDNTNTKKPFVLTVAFFPPHAVDGTKQQYYPQLETKQLYTNVTVDGISQQDMNTSYTKLPLHEYLFNDKTNEGRIRYHLRYDSDVKYQLMMKNYYRLVRGVDTACRKIFEQLEQQNLLHNTMILFTTDNGLYHGEHGLAGKWYPHVESTKVPLLIYDPRMPTEKRGTTIDDTFTLNIDLAPTILGAATTKRRTKTTNTVEDGAGDHDHIQEEDDENIILSSFTNQMQGYDLSELYLDDDYFFNGDDHDIMPRGDNAITFYKDDYGGQSSSRSLTAIEEEKEITSRRAQQQPFKTRRRRKRTEFYYEHPTLFGINRIPGSTALVRKDWKYIVWSTKAALMEQQRRDNITTSINSSGSNQTPPTDRFILEQLFHLTEDPYEETDLRYDPQYTNILNEMRQRHDVWKEWVKQ